MRGKKKIPNYALIISNNSVSGPKLKNCISYRKKKRIKGKKKNNLKVSTSSNTSFSISPNEIKGQAGERKRKESKDRYRYSATFVMLEHLVPSRLSFEISRERENVYTHAGTEDRTIAVKPVVDLRIRVYQPLGFRLFYICPMIYRPPVTDV